MKLSLSIVAICFGGFLALSCQNTQQTSTKEKQRPNFIIFYTDEMPVHYISSYGGDIHTPNIDRLAEQDLRLTNAYTAASMCTPSRYSALTGQYPGRCQHPAFLNQYPDSIPYSISWNTYLTTNTSTVAKELHRTGYRTGMAGKWHVSQLPDSISAPVFKAGDSLSHPKTQQKLNVFQQQVATVIRQEGGFQEVNSALFGNFDDFPHPDLKFHNIPWITKGAIDFLNAQKGSNAA